MDLPAETTERVSIYLPGCIRSEWTRVAYLIDLLKAHAPMLVEESDKWIDPPLAEHINTYMQSIQTPKKVSEGVPRCARLQLSKSPPNQICKSF